MWKAIQQTTAIVRQLSLLKAWYVKHFLTVFQILQSMSDEPWIEIETVMMEEW